MKKLLTDEQNALARTIMGVIDGHDVQDAFKAMVSIIAATSNHQLDGGEKSEALARAVAADIVRIMLAGQSGDYEMSDEIGRLQ